MVGDPRPVEPVPPERHRRLDAPERVIDVVRRRQSFGPRERTEDAITHAERAPGADPPGFDTERHVRVEAECLRRPGCIGRVCGSVEQGPAGRNVAVLEHRLTDEVDLHLAVDALRRADEDVLGVVVRRGSSVRCDGIGPAGRSDGQGVPHDHPTRWRLPRGPEHVGPGFVHPLRRHVDAVRTESERTRLAVEQAAEHARRIEPRHAQPVDATIGSHQRSGVAVGQEPVVGDRRERRLHRCALTRFAVHGTP